MKNNELPDFRYSWWDEIPDSDSDEGTSLVFGYYQRPFQYLHQDLELIGYIPEVPHPIRNRYWSLLPEREYELLEARDLLLTYIISIEHELSSIISKSSITYWLHLYRRLSPSSIGPDKRPLTAGLVRAALEASIQKYSKFILCDRIGGSDEIPITDVFDGLLMNPEFSFERDLLENSRGQLVLTRFTTIDLKEFYDAEKLAYELWRSTAQLRTIGKGGKLVVNHSSEIVFVKITSSLKKLINNHDNRYGTYSKIDSSSTGVTFSHYNEDSLSSGHIFLPTYNLGHILADEYNQFFKKYFEFELVSPSGVQYSFNYVWVPFDILSYRTAHLPFFPGFHEKHSVDLDAILCIITGLCTRAFLLWKSTKGNAIFRHWQRAYEGPYQIDYIYEEIENSLNFTKDLLGINRKTISMNEIIQAVNFLTLQKDNRFNIDLSYPGPHYIFLPYDKDSFFIDFTWIIRRLYDMFVGVTLEDQSFKGYILEKIIQPQKSPLPITPCVSKSGDMKQIDCSFLLNGRIVIVECKAIGKSISFDRGNPDAILFRKNKIDVALDEVDDKVEWLLENPIGRNYDISPYEDILPLVVSPFVEYIPSIDNRYWISPEIPRIITPDELFELIDTGKLLDITLNVSLMPNHL